MKILVLNSGSSSQKACLFDLTAPPSITPQEPLWEGKVEWKDGQAVLEVRSESGKTLGQYPESQTRAETTLSLLHTLKEGEARVIGDFSEVQAAGHRIVNGGRNYSAPTIITEEVRREVSKMADLAPLHNRAELEGIDLVEKCCGSIPQIAVFDTAFHHQLADAAAIYPVPYSWTEGGVRKFGFHGINHLYCAERAAQILGREARQLKIVSCHLGNGCSLAAIRDCKSIDTTMGFTPLDGLMMGTRSGSIDPGILTYVMRKHGLDGQELGRLLNHESGLLGVSGISSDMRVVLEKRSLGNQRASLAFDIFVHRLRSGIGSMAAALGGLDAIVFTGGIGENAAEVRSAACENFEFLGLSIERKKNQPAREDREISSRDSAVRVLVIKAQEDWAIARECWGLLNPKTVTH
jgi:acetate kinase